MELQNSAPKITKKRDEMLNSGAKFLFSQKTCSNQKGIYGSGRYPSFYISVRVFSFWSRI